MILSIKKDINNNGVEYKEVNINDNNNLDMTIKYSNGEVKKKTLYDPIFPVNIIKFLGTDSVVEELYNACNKHYNFNKSFDSCIDYIYNGFNESY